MTLSMGPTQDSRAWKWSPRLYDRNATAKIPSKSLPYAGHWILDSVLGISYFIKKLATQMHLRFGWLFLIGEI